MTVLVEIFGFHHLYEAPNNTVGEIMNTEISVPSAWRLPGVPTDPCTNWSEAFVRYKYKEPTQQKEQKKNNKNSQILNKV